MSDSKAPLGRRPGSRRDRSGNRHGDVSGIGPENLPRGSYEVGIVFKCAKHPRTNMGAIFRSTVPDDDQELQVRPIPGTNLLPKQNNNDEYPKLLFGCPECRHERIVGLGNAEAALKAIWKPWLRRVVHLKV